MFPKQISPKVVCVYEDISGFALIYHEDISIVRLTAISNFVLWQRLKLSLVHEWEITSHNVIIYPFHNLNSSLANLLVTEAPGDMIVLHLGLMQKRHDSSVLAMELHYFCIKPSIWPYNNSWLLPFDISILASQVDVSDCPLTPRLG